MSRTGLDASAFEDEKDAISAGGLMRIVGVGGGESSLRDVPNSILLESADGVRTTLRPYSASNLTLAWNSRTISKDTKRAEPQWTVQRTFVSDCFLS